VTQAEQGFLSKDDPEIAWQARSARRKLMPTAVELIRSVSPRQRPRCA